MRGQQLFDRINVDIAFLFVNRYFVRVHSIIFRSEAAQAARWLCVTDGSIRLLQTHSAACAARLLNNRERLRYFHRVKLATKKARHGDGLFLVRLLDFSPNFLPC
jgi:hypothetical protein